MESEAPPIRFVVGLGNPGSRYERTRHNIGFLALEELANKRGWHRRQSYDESETVVDGRVLRLIRPRTYMNRSGQAVEEVVGFYQCEIAELLVIVDDIYLPCGRLRIRAAGGTGGHRGLDSIVECTGVRDFPRLRVGVGSPPEEIALEEFVLATLEGVEWERFQRIATRTADAVRVACEVGVGPSMNRINSEPSE